MQARLPVVLAACLAVACRPDARSSASGPSFASFEAINVDEGMPVATKADLLAATWEATYAARLRNVASMSDAALAEAFTATDMVAYYAQFASTEASSLFVDRLHAIHVALAARDKSTDVQTATLFDHYVAQRRFEDAKKMRGEHPILRDREIPDVHLPVAFRHGAPAVMTLLPDGRYDVRNVPMRGPRVVVVVGCETSAEAVGALAQHAGLMEALDAVGTIWLAAADPGVGAPVVAAWNARFPRQPIQIAWSNPAWTGLDMASMPTFHYLLDGRVVDQHTGWDPGVTPGRIRSALSALHDLQGGSG